ncbi:MAG: hypothetical protein HN368_14720 [Spirochaetales bacterium]|jgi:trans-4-hydroxy-L-proline dehydratase|nr:hypothetical protein [Spirochaetales bacterium]
MQFRHNIAMDTVAHSRTAVFLSESRRRGASPPPSPRLANFAHGFFDLYGGRPYWKRYALSLAFAIKNEPVYSFSGERLTGMLYQTSGFTEDQKSLEEKLGPYRVGSEFERLAKEAGVDLPFEPYSAPGHVGWRWDRILADGIDGLLHDLRIRLAADRNDKSNQLYEGAIILWEAVLAWNNRHIDTLRQRGPDLGGLIEICERVPRFAARSFHEAVQGFYFQYLAVMFENPYGGNGPGRLDYFLWPYLERDLADGAISMADARNLVDELFIRLHERIQDVDGWVEAITVGGTQPDGSSSLNPLSYMMIESIMDLNQTHPSVYTRLSRNDPDEFIDLNVAYLLGGANRAQIYNDEACRGAVVKSGTSPEDAGMFMAGGCMEMSCQGMASDMNFTGTINVAKVLEYVINGGADLLSGEQILTAAKTIDRYTNFESFYGAFEGEIEREFTEWGKALDIGSSVYASLRPCYLLSSLVDDCLERGREQQDGGARYHDYGFSPLGLTAAADALSAIKSAVFDNPFMTAEELLAALRANYEGYEEIRVHLRNLTRYGVEDSGADKMADRVLSSICTRAKNTVNRFGGGLKPMLFSFVWIPGSSAELGARADGQFAGETIGHGITPQGIAMTAGITPAINSCVSLDYSVVNGGATTMWDMDPAWASAEIVKSVLIRFLEGGGMIFQGNTTSVAELERAVTEPEKYPNLIVRVGGFSARFTSLAPELQHEIVSRHRHSG